MDTLHCGVGLEACSHLNQFETTLISHVEVRVRLMGTHIAIHFDHVRTVGYDCEQLLLTTALILIIDVIIYVINRTPSNKTQVNMLVWWLLFFFLPFRLRKQANL